MNLLSPDHHGPGHFCSQEGGKVDQSMEQLYTDFLEQWDGNPDSTSICHFGDPDCSREEVVERMCAVMHCTQILTIGSCVVTIELRMICRAVIKRSTAQPHLHTG
jgi:hypothetical protein